MKQGASRGTFTVGKWRGMASSACEKRITLIPGREPTLPVGIFLSNFPRIFLRGGKVGYGCDHDGLNPRPLDDLPHLLEEGVEGQEDLHSGVIDLLLELVMAQQHVCAGIDAACLQDAETGDVTGRDVGQMDAYGISGPTAVLRQKVGKLAGKRVQVAVIDSAPHVVERDPVRHPLKGFPDEFRVGNGGIFQCRRHPFVIKLQPGLLIIEVLHTNPP